MKAGVLDPAKVTRSALQNAVSVASLLLTTEAVVADKPEPAGAAPRRRWRWRHARHGNDVSQFAQTKKGPCSAGAFFVRAFTKLRPRRPVFGHGCRSLDRENYLADEQVQAPSKLAKELPALGASKPTEQHEAS